MSKIRLLLTAEQAEAYYTYLDEMMGHVNDAKSVPLRIIVLNAMSVMEKIYAKQFLRKGLDMKLTEEQALALQYLMAVYLVPDHWHYTANAVRLVQQQLPQIEIPNPHNGQALLPGPQILPING